MKRTLLILAALSACLCPAPAGDNMWTTRFPEGGMIGSLAVDYMTGAVYAWTSSNGLYRSTSAGDSWYSVLSGRMPGHIAVDPHLQRNLLAGTNGFGVMKTTDDGVSWYARNNGLTSLNIWDMAYDFVTPGVVYVATFNGVFKTTNRGENWAQTGTALQGKFVQCLAVTPSAPVAIYAGTMSDKVFKSVDAGVTWVPASTGIPDGPIGTLVVDPAAPQTLYATSGPFVYKSVDGGGNWVQAAQVSSNIQSMTADPFTPDKFFVGTESHGVLKTVNGGTTWTSANFGLPTAFVYRILAHPFLPNTLYAGTVSHGLYRSIDGAQTWQPVNNGLRNAAVLSLTAHPATPVAYASANFSIYRTDDAGESWERTVFDGMAYGLAFRPESPTTAFAVAGSSFYGTTNGGATWSAPVNVGPVGSLTCIVADPVNAQRLYAGSTAAGVYTSANSGASWVPVNQGIDHAAIYTLAVDPTDPQVLYAGGGTLYRSPDGGANWTEISAGFDPSNVRSIAVHPTTPTTLYAGTEGGLYRSVNSGDNWVKVDLGKELDNESPIHVLFDPADPRIVYVGTYSRGVYRSLDGGQTWASFNRGLEDQAVRGLACAGGVARTLLAGTWGTGVFALTPLNEIYCAHMAGTLDWWTRINVVNLGAADNPVTFEAVNAAGVSLESKTLDHLPPLGSASLDVVSWFSPSTLAQDTWVRITSASPLKGLLEFGTQDGQSLITLPMTAVSSPSLVFPYVYTQPGVANAYFTGITLINVGNNTAQVTLDAYNENGNLLGTHVESVPEGGKYVRLVEQVFPTVTDPLQIRFVRVASSQPLIGFELFGKWGEMGFAGLPAFSQGIALAKNGAPEPSPASLPGSYELVFSEVPANADYFTGITFSCLGGSAAKAQVTVHGAEGQTLQLAEWPVEPLQQITREVWGLFVGVPVAGSSYLKISSAQPLTGFELFVSRGGSFRFDGLPAASTGSNRLVFPVIRAGGGYGSVVKLVNRTGLSLPFTLKAYGSDGVLRGTHPSSISAGYSMSFDVAALFPGTYAQVAWIAVEAEGQLSGDVFTAAADGAKIGCYPGLEGY
ncbi:MAG: hypothetical protein KA419_17930 [Acidobacteria bacterium]|nr:hypothetical protein [Acidobacteriota bacterium]